MRIIEYVFELKDSFAGKVVDIRDIMYWLGRIIGWASIFLLGYAGGSIIRGLLKGFGII